MPYMLILILCLVGWSSSVLAQQSPMLCQPYAVILESLSKSYGERIMARGESGEGRIVRVFRNPKTKTWTVVVSVTDDIGCIVGSGKNMEVPIIDDKRCVSAFNAT